METVIVSWVIKRADGTIEQGSTAIDDPDKLREMYRRDNAPVKKWLSGYHVGTFHITNSRYHFNQEETSP